MPPRADVVVIGAGIAGISTAYHLAVRHGVPRVTIVDPRPPLTLTSDKSTECYRNWWPNEPMVGLMNRSIDLLEEMAEKSLRTTLDGSVLTVALNRPQVHNAMNPQLIGDLTRLFWEIGSREDVRVVTLTGSGRTFCAGADLGAMRAAADYDFQQNVADGEAIFGLPFHVARFFRPTLLEELDNSLDLRLHRTLGKVCAFFDVFFGL